MGLNFKLKVGKSNWSDLNDSSRYPARLLSVTEDAMEWNGKVTDKFKFNFVILDPPDFEGRELNGMVNQPIGELNDRHKLYDWLTAFRNGVPLMVGEQMDFPREILGKIVMVQVKSKKSTKDGQERTFQNVDKVTVCQNPEDYEGRAPDKMPKLDDDEGDTEPVSDPEPPQEEPEAPSSPDPADTGGTEGEEFPEGSAAAEGDDSIGDDEIPF